MSVLAKGQDALHRQTIDPGDHGQKFRSVSHILSRLQQRWRVSVPARKPCDATSQHAVEGKEEYMLSLAFETIL